MLTRALRRIASLRVRRMPASTSFDVEPRRMDVDSATTEGTATARRAARQPTTVSSSTSEKPPPVRHEGGSRAGRMRRTLPAAHASGNGQVEERAR
jgi:hypothetical protein